MRKRETRYDGAVLSGWGVQLALCMVAALLAEIGSLDANVVDVSHLRTNPRLAVDEVEITIDLETRGAEHREQLLDHLRQRGYRITEVQ